MSDVGVKVVGADLVVARLTALPAVAFEAVAAVVILHGRLLETAVKRNASGRPGPNVITGDYRRSWSTRVRRSADSITSTTGTNRPQALRLEYGFHGADALGRVYNQPPFPHAQPAMDEIEPKLIAAAEAALAGLRL